MNFAKIRFWLAGLFVLALVGCGGGGSSSGDPILTGGGSTGGGTTSAASIALQVSPTATLGDGESTVTVTAIVKDANNVGLANTALTWGASAGNLTGAITTTDANGAATATFSATDRSAGTATVTARSGSASGTTVVTLRSARTLVVTSPATLQGVGTDGETAVVTATVKDPGNAAIAGASVSWSSDVGTLTNITSVTNAQGQATAIFSAGATRTLAQATVTVSSGTNSSSVQIPIFATATSIELLAAGPSVGTGGDTMTITASVKDSSNRAKIGAPVIWNTSSGTLSNVTTLTNNAGVATAVLSAGSVRINRTAVITAVSGLAQQTLAIPFVDTKLSHSGPTSAKLGTPVRMSFGVTDSKSAPVGGVELSFSSALGNPVPASLTTGGDGQATFEFAPTAAGDDKITVRGAGAQALVIDMKINGSDEDLAFTESPEVPVTVPVRQSKTLTVVYKKGGVLQANTLVNFAATIGSLSAASARTNAQGQASVDLESGFAGTSTVSATVISGINRVQAGLSVTIMATLPANVVLQLSQTALSPNAVGNSDQILTVFAKVTDADGNPVPAITVNFSQLADPSHGRLLEASAPTDSNGVAQVKYVSGPDSTASGAVQLQATVLVPATPSNPNPPSISASAVLTVNGESLFIALGTGNTIRNFDPQTYEKDWTVYVTDANGVRVPNKLVTVKIIPTFYGKGTLEWSDDASRWIYSPGVLAVPANPTTGAPAIVGVPPSPLLCANEDGGDFNGRLDPGEDFNGDRTLTPGNVVALTSSLITDINGAGTITMRYAESFASWISVRLTATATVAGTESTTFKEFPLDVLASDYSVKTVAPAGTSSPFGTNTFTCTNPN